MKTKIFKAITLLLILSLSLSAEILYQQSFEGATTDTWTYTASPDSYSNYTATDGWKKGFWGVGPEVGYENQYGLGDLFPTLDNTDYVWIAQNVQNSGGGNNASLTFATIDIKAYNEDLTLSFSYYAYGYTGDDYIKYCVEYNNGTSWDSVITKGTATNAWETVTINIPADSNYVRLQLTAKNNGTTQVAAFDWIRLELSGGIPSPITLSDFSANALSSGIELSWTTASEKENLGFKLYRDNEVIAFVDGAGTSTETNDYAYLDKNVIAGKSYTYTLADLSYNNEEVPHADKALTISAGLNSVENSSFNLSAAYPNPFNPSTGIDITLSQSADLDVSIYNVKGQKVASLHNAYTEAGSKHFVWNASDMKSGIYILKAISAGHVETLKLSLVK